MFVLKEFKLVYVILQWNISWISLSTSPSLDKIQNYVQCGLSWWSFPLSARNSFNPLIINMCVSWTINLMSTCSIISSHISVSIGQYATYPSEAVVVEPCIHACECLWLWWVHGCVRVPVYVCGMESIYKVHFVARPTQICNSVCSKPAREKETRDQRHIVHMRHHVWRCVAVSSALWSCETIRDQNVENKLVRKLFDLTTAGILMQCRTAGQQPQCNNNHAQAQHCQHKLCTF